VKTEKENLLNCKSSGGDAGKESAGAGREVRESARQVLCSFTSMLTERERMVLHWLANGLSVNDIWQRLPGGHQASRNVRIQEANCARQLNHAQAHRSNKTMTLSCIPA
jgi:DNA-binding NarL/FixJ family response regulator